MIKIVRAARVRDRVLRLAFSDGSWGNYDLAPLIERDTSLTRPLADDEYFARFFLELGALAWPNGLELAPGAIHRELEAGNLLSRETRVA
jgi:hypothetical protein